MKSKPGLIRMSRGIAGLIVSYMGCYGILALAHPGPSHMGRLGVVCALVCSVGAGVFFWARILASVAKERGWSPRNCQTAGLLVIFPGLILFLAGGRVSSTANILIQEALWTGMLCTKIAHPNFANVGPFDRDTAAALFPE